MHHGLHNNKQGEADASEASEALKHYAKEQLAILQHELQNR